MKKTKKKGFTLVELLVVIAIIGLLATLAVVSLNSARQKARDANRVSDMRQLQTAMELWYDSNSSSYAMTDTNCDAAGDTNVRVSLCDGNLSTYLPDITGLIDPSSTTACVNPATAVCDYSFATGPTASTYRINFWLEAGTGGYGTGAHSLDQAGMH